MSSQNDHKGTGPFEELPHVKNPESGIQQMFAVGIRNPDTRIRNPQWFGIRNPLWIRNPKG